MIVIKDLQYQYQNTSDGFALGPLDLTLPPSELVFWIGHNGSGKSTAARILSGDYEPCDGTISGLPEQTFYYHQSVGENIFLDLNVGQHFELLSRKPWRTVKDHLTKVFPQMADLWGHFPDELSGGQRQLVGFATTIIEPPRVLLLDEVVNHLDSDSAKHILDMLKALLREKNDTFCVIITHDLSLAREYADKIQVFREGKIVCTLDRIHLDSDLSIPDLIAKHSGARSDELQY